MKLKALFGMLPLFAVLPLQALEKPTQEEVVKVMQYLNEGEEIVLVDSKFCTEIVKKGEDKNECADPGVNEVAKGAKKYLWMNYLVPGNSTPSVLVQFKFKGRALKSDEIKLSKTIRYRTWKFLETSRVGHWEVVIEQETEAGFVPVATIPYTVTEVAQ